MNFTLALEPWTVFLVVMPQTESPQTAGSEFLVTKLHLSTKIVDGVSGGDAAD